MIETKANVKSAELLFSKRQKSEDVLEVVVPPKKRKRNNVKQILSLTLSFKCLAPVGFLKEVSYV